MVRMASLQCMLMHSTVLNLVTGAPNVTIIVAVSIKITTSEPATEVKGIGGGVRKMRIVDRIVIFHKVVAFDRIHQKIAHAEGWRGCRVLCHFAVGHRGPGGVVKRGLLAVGLPVIKLGRSVRGWRIHSEGAGEGRERELNKREPLKRENTCSARLSIRLEQELA
ncbi:hypothetical protein C8F04DRAFT_299543 [Mycena alexandri]|uniref:Secreted protein n=1 Tax=Mycena alexandri TaxID=1745969 RepID=A0AAD6T9A7_9AGAR|nr:hypothetical protein C8F04DRAFT_299543 [Mycena alexandri]